MSARYSEGYSGILRPICHSGKVTNLSKLPSCEAHSVVTEGAERLTSGFPAQESLLLPEVQGLVWRRHLGGQELRNWGRETWLHTAVRGPWFSLGSSTIPSRLLCWKREWGCAGPPRGSVVGIRLAALSVMKKACPCHTACFPAGSRGSQSAGPWAIQKSTLSFYGKGRRLG